MSPPSVHELADEALVSTTVGAQIIGVSTSTLRSYDRTGKVRSVRTPGNQRRFRVGDLRALLVSTPSEPASDEPSATAS